jgi:hypothetical protein
MSQSLNEQVAKILENLQVSTPEVVTQYQAAMVLNQVAWLFWALFLAAAAFAIYKLLRKTDDNQQVIRDEVGRGLLWALWGLLFFCSAWTVISSILELFQVINYPLGYMLHQIITTLGHKS